VYSNGILNDIFGGRTAEKLLKSRTLNGAFLRYLKRCFGSWDCRETFENKDAYWCKLTLLIRCFRNLELLRNFLKRGC